MTIGQKHKIEKKYTSTRENVCVYVCVCASKKTRKSEFIAALSGKAPKSALV